MKLMLVDDHALFIEGLQYLLTTYDIPVVGKAKNGKEALLKARILNPDIILMDIRMPECGGLEAVKLIKAEMPDIHIVMLTSSEDDEDLFDAIKYGASGYLLKDTNCKDLIDMLADIENGGVPLSPGLARRVLNEFRHNSNTYEGILPHVCENVKRENLTERQREVLELVARGATYKETGEALGLTERTIKYHMGRILELLHLESKAQVITYAAQKGIIDNK